MSYKPQKALKPSNREAVVGHRAQKGRPPHYCPTFNELYGLCIQAPLISRLAEQRETLDHQADYEAVDD